MAKHVTMNMDKTFAVTEDGDRLLFVPESSFNCGACFFCDRCTSSGLYASPGGSTACISMARPDNRNGHWEKAY